MDEHTPWSLGALLVAGHPPLGGACSLSSLRDEVRTVPMGGRVERRLELLMQGNSPQCPRGSFSFWEKSSCSFLWLPPYKEGPVLSHSPPLQLGQGLCRSGSHTAQLSTCLGQHLGLPGFSTSYLFPSLRLQATRSLTVFLRPYLAGEGTLNLALSRKSCGRPGRGGPGTAVALVPTLVPGIFFS